MEDCKRTKSALGAWIIAQVCIQNSAHKTKGVFQLLADGILVHCKLTPVSTSLLLMFSVEGSLLPVSSFSSLFPWMCFLLIYCNCIIWCVKISEK